MKESQKHIDKKAEILKDAITGIQKYGYENVSIRQICKELNITTGTFYHYFNGKNDIIAEQFTWMDQRYLTEVKPNLTNDNELDNILYFCNFYAEFTYKKGLSKSIEISQIKLTDNNGFYTSNHRIMKQILLEIIQRGQNKAQIKEPVIARELVNMVIVMIRGYSFDWSRKEATYDLIYYTNLNIKLFLNGISQNTFLYF